MKLALTIAGSDALPTAFVVMRGFEESIKKAAAMGYHGVELALKTAEEIVPDQLATWLDREKLQISCITTGQVFSDLGLYFTHPDIQKRKETVELFKRLILLAKDFGGMVNIGRVRGFITNGATYEETVSLFTRTASELLAFAREHGVTLILEPVNRYETNFVNTVGEGAALLPSLQGMGLMPDVFHMNIEEASIGNSLRMQAHFVRYIHLADSNRRAPGCGHIQFEEVFDALADMQYDGWASVEILPLPDPDTAARQAAEFLLPKIDLYNKRQ